MFQTVSTASANVKSLLITLTAPDGDDQVYILTNFVFMYISTVYENSTNFLNFSDQNFSLVIVLTLFLIFGQFSVSLGVLYIKFVLIKTKRVIENTCI